MKEKGVLIWERKGYGYERGRGINLGEEGV